MWLELGMVLVLVLINGLFSGAEIATVTLRKTRLDQLVNEGSKAAAAAAELRSNTERFLATVQVGITVVGAAAAAYGGDTLAARLLPLLEPFLGSWAGGVSFGVVVVFISFLSLVLGELVPKSLALRATEPYALFVARPLLGLSVIARPVIWVLTASSNLVLKLFGDSTSFSEARVSPDELKAMVEEAADVGSLHPAVGEMASRALDMTDLVANDVMLPRHHIAALPKSASIDDLREIVRERGHSRVPIYDGNLDNVVGVVAVADAFVVADLTSIAPLVKPVVFVAERMRALDVLRELQARGGEVGIVVDEHGVTRGLVTREDIAEELLGEDVRSKSPASMKKTVREADGSIVIPGETPVRELNRELGLDLPESDEWTTIAGLSVVRFGRIPGRGERTVVEGVGTLEIVDASPRRVRAVRLLPDAGEVAAEAAGDDDDRGDDGEGRSG